MNRRHAIERLIEDVLDGSLPERERRALLDAIRHDPDAMRELTSAADTVSHLRAPVEAPDLADRILHAADSRRPFLPRPLRRMVDRGRIATAASLLLVLAALSLVHRNWPDALRLTDEPRPVTDVSRALHDDATHWAGLVSTEVGRARQTLASAAEPALLAPRAPAPLEAYVLGTVGPDGSRYDSLLVIDRHAPVQHALRVYHVPLDADAPLLVPALFSDPDRERPAGPLP